jgi:uncharacterized protein (DUF433 family)
VIWNLPDRIDIDPEVCFGKPCVKGTRVWVGLVLSMMADGMTSEEILEQYPQLADDDLRACLAYGSLLAVSRIVDLR